MSVGQFVGCVSVLQTFYKFTYFAVVLLSALKAFSFSTGISWSHQTPLLDIPYRAAGDSEISALLVSLSGLAADATDSDEPGQAKRTGPGFVRLLQWDTAAAVYLTPGADALPVSLLSMMTATAPSTIQANWERPAAMTESSLPSRRWSPSHCLRCHQPLASLPASSVAVPWSRSGPVIQIGLCKTPSSSSPLRRTALGPSRYPRQVA